MAFHRAASSQDLPPGAVREFAVHGKAIALANVNGKVFAISNECAHVGGPLGEGTLEGQTLTCPWHGWQYDVCTGKVLGDDTQGVGVYRVEVRGADIFVDI